MLQDKNGKALKDNSKPIKKYGVKDQDTLKLSKAGPHGTE